MGGKSSVVNPLGRNFLGTGGTPLNRPLSAFGSGGISEATRTNPFGIPINNPLAYENQQPKNPGVPGPFTLDQGQFEGDRAAINAEGQRQYNDTIAGLGEVGKANTKRASELFGSMLPDIAENAQAAHLYDSTGYGQEVARQQAQIASQVANNEAQQRQAALGGLQGFQTGALQRGLGLEDFINQANVAKTIGAQTAPQPPSSKATGFSRGVAGAGAGSQIGGPFGAAIGGGAGLLSGGK